LGGPRFDTGELNAKEKHVNPAPAAPDLPVSLTMPPPGLSDDENVGDSGEITIPVVRTARAGQTTTASAPDTSVSAQLDSTSITSDVSSATTPPGDSAPFGDGAPVQVVPTPVPRARERRTSRVGAIVGVSVGALLLLCVLGAGVWFVLHRRSLTVAPTNTNANTPVVVAPDAQQQAQAKVTEA